MLTKWGAALGLASAGRVVAGGSGALGDATVWGPVLDWTALGTIAGPLRPGDLAPVTDLQPGYGLATYNGTDWELYQAVFATVADLNAFGGGGELIGSGAIATVGTGIETDPAYYYDGAQWLRMPDGVHYIWQQRADWTALGTIPAPQNNDRVAVQTLGTAHSSGFAERHGGTWKLVQGRFASVADMVAFSNSVHAGAFAEVKSGGGHDDDSVTYVYQSGAWVRYAALTAGFAWTLTETQLLTGADPSGIGAVQEGDYGTYTPTGGVPIVVRYKAATPVAGGVSGGAQAQWLPPEVYAGTPEIKAFLVGTEAVTTDTTLNAQGWGTVVRTNGTITSQTTRVRLATTSSNARASISTLTSGVTTSTRVYVRWLYRVATGNQTLDNSTTATLRFFDGATGQFLAMPASADVSKGVFFWTGSGVVSSGSQQSSQPALPNLTGTDTLMEAYLDTSTNLATVYRDGVATTASVRISNATADSLIFWAASGSTATQTSSMDLSRVMVATW